MKNLDNKTMEIARFESFFPENARFDELEKLAIYIKDGNPCQLIGLPGVGRSTTLRLLAYNKSVRLKHFNKNVQWLHFVLIDFSEASGRPFSDLLKHMLFSISESLRERQMNEECKKVQSFVEKYTTTNEDIIILDGLKQIIDYLSLEKKLTIVFLFDKFELYIPMLTNKFFIHLKALQNRAKYRLVSVFSVNRPLEEILDETILPDAYGFLGKRNVFLPILDEPSLNFAISYFEKISQKKIVKDIRDIVISQTAGHGKLTKISIEQVIAEGVLENIPTFLEGDKTVRSLLYEIWNHLTTEEQEQLKNLTRIKTIDKKDLNENNESPYLVRSSLILNNTISIPLLASFASYRAGRVIEKITVSENGKEIYRGESKISDQFTNSEFFLLKLFLENKENIVERSDIIDAIWKNSKSTEGVTDQAIDQLIFRLRKKIEKEPNNPSHIITIKGRGFKFIA